MVHAKVKMFYVLSYQTPTKSLFRVILFSFSVVNGAWFKQDNFFTIENMIMDRGHILAGDHVLKIQCHNHGFISCKHTAFGFTRYYLTNWSGVDYCDVFISCLNSHSDGTHSLQRIHRWASDVMLHLSKPVAENSLKILLKIHVYFIFFTIQIVAKQLHRNI